MKYKVQLVHNLDYTVTDLGESKIEHAQIFQDFIIKERQNTNTEDAKLDI